MNVTPHINKETKTIYLNRVVNYNYILNLNSNYRDIPCNIHLTAVSERELQEIEYFKKSDLETKSKIADKFSHINLPNIIMLGNGNKSSSSFSNLEGLLEKFVYKDRERIANRLYYKSIKDFYRNYEVPRSTWLKNSDLVNMCPDIKMSWQSALRKLGAKNVHGLNNKFEPFYVIIWFDTISDDELKKLYNL